MKKIAIIGAGAFGINIASQLLEKGEKITLITEPNIYRKQNKNNQINQNNQKSISSIYANGIMLNTPKKHVLRENT